MNRPTHYLVRIVATDEVSSVPFSRADFEGAGVPFSPLAGMPQLEAFQLVNKWNVTQPYQQRVYGLA